jgi:hypothetical protein
MDVAIPRIVADEARRYFRDFVALRIVAHSSLTTEIAKRGAAIAVPYYPKDVTGFAMRLRDFARVLSATPESALFVGFGFIMNEHLYAVVLLPKVPTQPVSASVVATATAASTLLGALDKLIPSLEMFVNTPASAPFLRHPDEVFSNCELVSTGDGDVQLVLQTRSQLHNVTMSYVVELDEQQRISGLSETPDNRCDQCLQDYTQQFAAAWLATEDNNAT